MERTLIKEKCIFCDLPVYSDQGYSTASLSHARCLSENRKRVDEDIQNSGVKSNPGEGVLSKRVKERVVSLVESHYSLKAVKAVLWVQQGFYRRSGLDLAKWGCYITLQNGLIVSVSSFATMTNWIRPRYSATLSLITEGTHTYDV